MTSHIAERTYVIRTVTRDDGSDPHTDEDIYLTMYDAAGNACAERHLWHNADPFEWGA